MGITKTVAERRRARIADNVNAGLEGTRISVMATSLRKGPYVVSVGYLSEEQMQRFVRLLKDYEQKRD